MKWVIGLGILAGAAAAGLALLALLGSRLPRHHVATRRVVIRRPPADVYAVIRDLAGAAEWRKDVKEVTPLGEVGGHLRFREEGSNGAMTLEIVEEVRDVRLVTRIADLDLPFGGSWTYELKAAAQGTELAITERGEVKPALFRALSAYVFTHHATIERYLRALGKRFGEEVRPEA